MCGQIPPVSLSPEEREQLYERRVKGLQQLRILSIVMLVCSKLYITMGILLLVFLDGKGDFPFNSGSPIWSGAVITVASYLGLWTSFADPNIDENNPPAKLRGLLIAFYSVSVTSTSLIGISFGYTLGGLLTCQNSDDYSNCKLMRTAISVTSGVILLMAVVLIICCILVMVFYCVNRKPFFIYSNRELLQSRIQRLEQQIEKLEQDHDGSLNINPRPVDYEYTQTESETSTAKQLSSRANYQSIYDPPPAYTK